MEKQAQNVRLLYLRDFNLLLEAFNLWLCINCCKSKGYEVQLYGCGCTFKGSAFPRLIYKVYKGSIPFLGTYSFIVQLDRTFLCERKNTSSNLVETTTWKVNQSGNWRRLESDWVGKLTGTRALCLPLN